MGEHDDDGTSARVASIDGGLDSEHQEMLQRVLDKDTPVAQREIARWFSGRLTGDITALREAQSDLGLKEQMDAIRATGWCSWVTFFLTVAWVLVAIDTLIWAFGAARVLRLE